MRYTGPMGSTTPAPSVAADEPSRPPAPEPLELVRQFVNTLDVGVGRRRARGRDGGAVMVRRRATCSTRRPRCSAADQRAGGRAARGAARAAAREQRRAARRRRGRRRSTRSRVEARSRRASTRPAASGSRWARRWRRRRARPADRRRLQAVADGTLVPAQGVPRGRLPVGVLRPLAQPVGPVVRHGRLRQPQQGPYATASAKREK